MSAARHTPGPWTASIDGPRRRPRMALVHTGAGKQSIDCTGSGPSFDVDAANARLIAAAPDLLAALKALLDDGSITYAVRAQRARAVVAKVEAGV